MEEIFIIKKNIDDIYNRVFNGEKDISNDLDIEISRLLKYENKLNHLEEDINKTNFLVEDISNKIRLIYEMLQLQTDSSLSIEILREQLKILEIKKFNIENNYVMGILKIDELNEFKDILFSFRKKLYAIQINDDILLEIAKMKSKIQHFDTYILEDEEILKQSYENSN